VHHGRVTTRNAEDGGAIFELILPLEAMPPTTPTDVRG
jgi:hypothetical protein